MGLAVVRIACDNRVEIGFLQGLGAERARAIEAEVSYDTTQDEADDSRDDGCDKRHRACRLGRLLLGLLILCSIGLLRIQFGFRLLFCHAQ